MSKRPAQEFPVRAGYSSAGGYSKSLQYSQRPWFRLAQSSHSGAPQFTQRWKQRASARRKQSLHSIIAININPFQARCIVPEGGLIYASPPRKILRVARRKASTSSKLFAWPMLARTAPRRSVPRQRWVPGAQCSPPRTAMPRRLYASATSLEPRSPRLKLTMPARADYSCGQ